MRWKILATFAVVGVQGLLADVARAQSNVVAWGVNNVGQCNVPALPPGLSYVKVEASTDDTVARRSDGSVVAWGDNSSGQCNVPALPAGLSYVDVVPGWYHTVACRSDGSVVAWGDNQFGQCNVPALPAGLNYVEVAAGRYHSVARCSDGSVVAWGGNNSGQCNVPALPPGLSYVEIAAGDSHTVARCSDGSVVAWGFNGFGQCNVPALPPGLTYVEIAAGRYHTLARYSDGRIVAWGWNLHGQCNVPTLPPGLNYVEVAAGYQHSLARTGCIQPIPSAPTALLADGSSGSHIALSWTDNANDEQGFSIERALAGSGSWALIGNTLPDGTAFKDTTVSCAIIYDYRVSAFNCAGSSAYAQATPADCFPPPAPYCTAKLNSLGCDPTIGWTGSPTVSGATDDFYVNAQDVFNRKPGLMIWGLQPGSMPLGGGTLCISPPIVRTLGQNSGGSAAPQVDCSGLYSFHFGHGYIQNNFLVAGQTVRAQYWSRDSGFVAPNAIGLTNALGFTLLP